MRWSGPGGGVSPVAVSPPGAGWGAGRNSHSARVQAQHDGALEELVDVLGVDEAHVAAARLDHQPVEDVLLLHAEDVTEGPDVQAVGRDDLQPGTGDEPARRRSMIHGSEHTHAPSG